jgi:hypothetical protein
MSAPYSLGLELQLGISSPRRRKIDFATLSSWLTGLCRRQNELVDPHAGAAITLPIARCQALPRVRMRT